MPVKQQKSGLMAQLGDEGRKAIAGHKNDETVFDIGGDLPAGIEGGTAQLVECKLDIYKKGENKGKLYFHASGIVVSPEEFEGMRITGKRTMIQEPLCPTPNSQGRKEVSEHMAWIMNQLRLLGVNTTKMADDGSDFEETLLALKAAQPHYLFRTWKGQKQTTGKYAGQEPRVNHVWCGLVDHQGLGQQDAATAGIISEETVEGSDETVTETTTDDAPTDLTGLAAEADNNDVSAQEKLKAEALAVGIDNAAIESANSWAEVVEMIQSAGSPTEEEASEEAVVEDETPFVPEQGTVYGYEMLNAKTKKKQVYGCEVIKVFPKNSTVHLKNLTTNAVVAGADKKPLNVKWEALVNAP